VRACAACGRECRHRTVALVLPEAKRSKVCRSCAQGGLLVVAATAPTVMRQEPLFATDPLESVRSTLSMWAKLEAAKSQAVDGNEGDGLYALGRASAYENAAELIKRTKETGT
jgi:hypothetical protein